MLAHGTPGGRAAPLMDILGGYDSPFLFCIGFQMCVNFNFTLLNNHI